MKYPKYNVNEYAGGFFEYITPCPYGIHGRYTKEHIMVGSLACQRCNFFKGINKEDNIVSCGIK